MADAELDSKAAQPSGTLSRWTPSIPSNLMSMLNPFSNDEGEPKSSSDAPHKRQSILSSFLSNVTPTDPPSPQKDDESIMFAEPDSNSTSDDASCGDSLEDSGRRYSKRCNKSKTCFSICHPAPSSTTRQKLHRRPRSLLQLHKLSSDARPRPAFEVVASANFSVRLTRATTKVFKTKHGLCPNDLVVMKAEKYSAREPDEEQEARDIIALICKGRKDDATAPGKAKICLPDGQEWEAYPTLQGGYEFFTTDEHGLGLTVRWVPKRNKDGSKPTGPERRKFNFSTISPNSRRHPVIATLSRTQLHVNDTFKMPDPAAVTPLSTPKQNSTFLTDTMEEDEQDGREKCETDERLRNIIVMTSIWVAFKEGWSPNFKYDDKDIVSPQRSPSLQSSPTKSSIFAVTTPPGSPGMTPLEKRGSFMSVGSGILRSGSLLRKGDRRSAASVPEVQVAQMDETKRTGRPRAESASTVLVHRAASNRAKHNQATWNPDMLDAQRELSEPPSEPSTPVPQRRKSVARPILPPAETGSTESSFGEDGAGDVATLRSVGVPKSPSPEKRESSATTSTTGMSNEGSRKPQHGDALTRKKRGGWRRLLCGSQQDV